MRQPWRNGLGRATMCLSCEDSVCLTLEICIPPLSAHAVSANPTDGLSGGTGKQDLEQSVETSALSLTPVSSNLPVVLGFRRSKCIRGTLSVSPWFEMGKLRQVAGLGPKAHCGTLSPTQRSQLPSPSSLPWQRVLDPALLGEGQRRQLPPPWSQWPSQLKSFG